MLVSFVIWDSREGEGDEERSPREVKSVILDLLTSGQVAGNGLRRPAVPLASRLLGPPLTHVLTPRNVSPPQPVTCGVGQIWAFVPRPSPAAPRDARGANTAERQGSCASPAPHIFGPRGVDLAGQLRD